MRARSAVVTAMELITPLGVGLDRSWKRLVRGESGIDRISLFDPSGHKCQIAGECRDFNPEDFLDRKTITRFDRMVHLFVAAALLTIENWRFQYRGDPFRFSVIGASAIGCPSTFEQNHAELLRRGPRKVSPFCVVAIAANTAACEVARRIGAKGPQYFLQEACAAGTKAMATATALIRQNVIDAAVVVGADAGITPTIMASLENLGAITTGQWNETPSKASRPFDRERKGFVPSEGAGCVILEALEHAEKRGAEPLAEVAGIGATCDAHHPTAAEPSGESIIQCMKQAIKDAGIRPEEVNYINAHGTSTPLNDLVETRAIKKVFGPKAYQIPISSNKSMIGHLWGAAGIVESIFTVKSILDGIIPPTINLDFPDPECDLDYVPNLSRPADIRIALTNSFGFGGINASLVIKKVEE
ncbi:beta-ketoacyl-[acyl-carrier-protein] synthase family protein [Thermodesulforhabdus norvegica]|uniref:3-oxoacyl-[acyl-carrier-protein] synthase II n=1 Tax=Thermodesulforhabdus norvegica TaxID=39841 RepID=A0A1I4V9Y2_9BACT|nr:beta-ketoacyl-[acyl-carrier-protein] synthase II [Thermodesulforhabdus norvegica]SFM97989.1 3-oxoacyl-[acyl-carrier-protein] synthase II [Thermodesulforhabdus norvegica]